MPPQTPATLRSLRLRTSAGRVGGGGKVAVGDGVPGSVVSLMAASLTPSRGTRIRDGPWCTPGRTLSEPPHPTGADPDARERWIDHHGRVTDTAARTGAAASPRTPG